MWKFALFLGINLLGSLVDCENDSGFNGITSSRVGMREGRKYVVGGVDAAPGSYPHQVSIRYYDQFLCAGSIIDDRNVLTSAGCAAEIVDLRKYFKVHGGTNLLSGEGGSSYDIVRVKIHAGYSAEPYNSRFDIAILTLGEQIEFSEILQPVELDNGTESYEKERALLIGWGSKGSGAIYNDRLQEAEVAIVPEGNCRLVYQDLKDYQFCAYNPGTGICEADSGTALMLDGKQIGLASFNKGCASGNPDVYTRISHFVDWIEKNKSNSSDMPLFSTTLFLPAALLTLFFHLFTW